MGEDAEDEGAERGRFLDQSEATADGARVPERQQQEERLIEGV